MIANRILVALMTLASVVFSASVDEWQTVPKVQVTDGFPIQPFDSTVSLRIDSLEFEIRDAFDDAVTHSPADRWVYALGNSLHWETRESVVRKLLFFDQGDSVTLRQLLESERKLRDQVYISDARISHRRLADGRNVFRVITSDNWTTTVPVSLSAPGGKLVYQVGLLENNFLGMGQSMGIFFLHDELRDQRYLFYENTQFIWRHHRFRAIWSDNSDGYSNSFHFSLPYLGRSRNQWAYTIEGSTAKRTQNVYWSGSERPAHSIVQPGEFPNANPRLFALDGANPVVQFSDMREDSVSLRLGRSFGGDLKTYARVSYDYKREGEPAPTFGRWILEDAQGQWMVDSTAARAMAPHKGDSRLGVQLTMSRLRYAKLRNYHHVKWTEDVDRGWSYTAGVARNSEALGALDERWFVNQATFLGVGLYNHQLEVRSRWESYLQGKERQDDYAQVSAEHMYKPSPWWSGVLLGSLDRWSRAPLGRQLYLGGLEGMPGLPSYVMAGQARAFGQAEVRWFPQFELGTLVPVFSSYVSAGQTAPDLASLDADSLTYVAGLGIRLGMSKSVYGIVNHINIGWALNGPMVDQWNQPRFSLLARMSL